MEIPFILANVAQGVKAITDEFFAEEEEEKDEEKQEEEKKEEDGEEEDGEDGRTLQLTATLPDVASFAILVYKATEEKRS